MICAVDHFQHYSPYAPSFMVSPQLPHSFDLTPMHASHSPPGRASSVGEGYFPVPSISTSNRQRTAQACDKCRERKTKCSGEKPVCQRCANRGLICEYTCREPRMRGPSRTRLTSTSTPPITAGDVKQRISLLPSFAHDKFSRSYPAIIPAEYTVSGYASTKHPISSSPYFGTETRSYSEARIMQYPHWADIRLRPSVLPSDCDASQLRMTAPQDTMRIEYDPYRSLKHLQKRHNSISNGILNSISRFEFKAQEKPRYNNSDHSSLYNYPTSNLAQSSGLSDNSSPGYHSSSALSPSTPTLPFYSQETLEGAAHPETYGRFIMSDYSHNTAGKDIYQNDDLVPVKFPYVGKEAEIQEDWPITRNLRPEFMWSVDVDLNVCRLGAEKGVQS